MPPSHCSNLPMCRLVAPVNAPCSWPNSSLSSSVSGIAAQLIARKGRWARALEDAASRCEAVLFLVSQDWISSKWCGDEYQLANKFNKKLFALLVDDVPLDRLPGGLTAQWQVVRLKGEPAERFLTVHPRTQLQSPVAIAEAGLKSLKRGLEKAGIGPGTF